jgi:hypothetical protein
LSVAILFFGLTKVGLALASPFSDSGLQSYYYAIAYTFVPSILIFFVALFSRQFKNSQPNPPVAAGPAVLATLALGVASILFPQFEIMVMQRTQGSEVFYDFARVSLFYKIAFFAFTVLAQWLLPHQIRSQADHTGLIRDYRFALACVVLPLIATGATPLVGQMILGWEQTPPLSWVFLSCMNICFLTAIFLLIQNACARQKTQRGLVFLILTLLPGFIQLGLKLSVENYYFLVLLWNASILFGAINIKSSTVGELAR